jgi:hypothetical protein
MIGQGNLNNGKISAQGVVRALNIYGPVLGSLKGKTTCRKPHLEEEPELINQQFESQTMYLDLMFAKGTIQNICYEPIRICACDQTFKSRQMDTMVQT